MKRPKKSPEQNIADYAIYVVASEAAELEILMLAQRDECLARDPRFANSPVRFSDAVRR